VQVKKTLVFITFLLIGATSSQTFSFAPSNRSIFLNDILENQVRENEQIIILLFFFIFVDTLSYRWHFFCY